MNECSENKIVKMYCYIAIEKFQKFLLLLYYFSKLISIGEILSIKINYLVDRRYNENYRNFYACSRCMCLL